MKSYYELLQDPRWQKKRLEIMQKNDFKCQNCFAEDNKLNIHHGCYVKDLLPWEYRDEQYHCLCDKCHQEIHRVKSLLDDAISDIPIYQLHEVIGFSLGLWVESHPYGRVRLENSAEAVGLSKCWDLDEDLIRSYLQCI